MNSAAKRKRKTKKSRRPKRLCHAAKISDYRFKRLLRYFAEDLSATETAARMRLSVNAVSEIYGKLRAFFAETGLFASLYEADPTPEPEDELQYIGFHLARVAEMRGLPADDRNNDLHFRESCWRFECRMLAELGARNMRETMYRDLLALIRLCGPVGRPPRNRLAARRYLLERNDRIAAWLQRNSPAMSDSRYRRELQQIRDL